MIFEARIGYVALSNAPNFLFFLSSCCIVNLNGNFIVVSRVTIDRVSRKW